MKLTSNRKKVKKVKKLELKDFRKALKTYISDNIPKKISKTNQIFCDGFTLADEAHFSREQIIINMTGKVLIDLETEFMRIWDEQ